MAEKHKITFPAEIKLVSSKKTASLDKEYRVVLATNDQSAMLLDVFSSDVLVDVTVEAQD
jgi:hypothetical protein